jgi:hypothetical protein
LCARQEDVASSFEAPSPAATSASSAAAAIKLADNAEESEIGDASVIGIGFWARTDRL